MRESEKKLPNPVLAAGGAALFVIAAGLAFVWLIEAYHKEAVYTELLRLAAVARVDAPDIDRILENMHESDAISAPLRAAAAVIFLCAIVAARAAWQLIAQAEEIEEQRKQRWDMQRQLQDRTLRLRENRQNLEKMQKIDGLTQVSNRHVLEDAIEREWRRAARMKGPVSLIMLDVDGMTEFNDLFGHIAGDGYLKSLATELQKLGGRPTDVVGRFEGDVFALVLGATDTDGARVLADACRRCAHTVIEGMDDKPPPGLLTVSVAAVTARPAMDSEPNNFVLEAHSGIEDAKKAGGDSIASRKI